MKKAFSYFSLLITLSASAYIAHAQKEAQQNTFNYAEQMPTPTVDIGEYVQQHLQYPIAASNRGIHGRVMLSLMIDSSGNIGNIKIVESVDPLLDSEAVRVVRTLPKFKPGTNAGRRIATNYLLPIQFNLAQQAPQAPRASVDINAYLAKHLVYPKDAKDQHIEGTVSVKFVIDTTGHILYPQVTKYLFPSCDAEAIRLVKGMPPFSPAMQKGKAVNVYFELPVVFKLKS